MTTYTYSGIPAMYVEVPDTDNAGQVKRPDTGTVVSIRDAATGAAVTGLTDTSGTSITELVTTAYGYLSFLCESASVELSGDGENWWRVYGVEAMDAAISAGDATAVANEALSAANSAETTATSAASAAAAAQATATSAYTLASEVTASGFGPNWVAAYDAPDAIRSAVTAAGGVVAGSTDAGATINTALGTYKAVFLTEGSFPIGTTVVMPQGRSLVGAGPYATQLAGTTATASTLVTVTKDHVTIRGVSLNLGAVPTSTTVHGIDANMTSSTGFWTGSDGCLVVENVVIRNLTGDGVRMQGTYNRDCKLSKIHVWNVAGRGFYLNCPDGSGEQLIAGTCGSHGVMVDSSASNWRLVNCKAWYADGDGFFLSGGARHAVDSCEAQDNALSGFRVCTNLSSFVNCTADSNNYDGSGATGTHSGFDVGITSTAGTSGGYDIQLVGCKSWDKNESSRGYLQAYGFHFRTGVRGLALSGCSTGDPSSTHHNLTAGMLFDTSTDQTHASNLVSSVIDRVALATP